MRQRTISRGVRGGRTPLLLTLVVTAAACTGGGDYPGLRSERVAPAPSSDPPWDRFDRPGSDGPAPATAPPLPPGAAPDFGETVTLDSAPPSLGAASLVISDDGATAIATDTDRDRIAIVNLATKEATLVPLAAGDEPGRLTMDDSNRVHVVLERAGEVATIDLASAAVVARRPVCVAPKGIARSGADLYVACTGGEIVTLPTDPVGTAHLLTRIDSDLRDVVVIGADLLVSRLRTAQVLRVRRTDGVLLARAARPRGDSSEPSVGWRLAMSGAESAVLVHQMARTDTVDVSTPGAYGAGDSCNGPVVTVITSFTPTETGLSVEPRAKFSQAVVPVDVARRHQGGTWTVVAAGNGHIKELPKLQDAMGTWNGTACLSPVVVPNKPADPIVSPDGQAVALAFTPDDNLVVFSREPAAIHVGATSGSSPWTTIPLGGASREDTGHAIFHTNSGRGIACVSCHPGGGDDGRVWSFSTGTRRTQTLEGTLDGTAPYHWGGDMESIESFGGPVFGKRMGGPHLDYARLDALRVYLTRLPAPRISPARNPAAAARGKTLFESAEVGCSGCHSGEKLTNNESVDVGTGAVFQVPSLLGVGLRAPYLHDGRAKTLLDRFGPGGGGDSHGQTSTLTTSQLADLVSYLESL